MKASSISRHRLLQRFAAKIHADESAIATQVARSTISARAFSEITASDSSMTEDLNFSALDANLEQLHAADSSLGQHVVTHLRRHPRGLKGRVLGVVPNRVNPRRDGDYYYD